MKASLNHDKEVVTSVGACCANTLTTDHFCGNGSVIARNKKSRCNICGQSVMAEVWRSNDNPPRAYMRKYCNEHGITSSRLSSDASFYHVKQEGQANCCGPAGCLPTELGENAKTASQLHTCTLVVEIVRDCNLSCNTCYADSPKLPHGQDHDILSFEAFKQQVLPVLEKQGSIDIIQLSGGEPTLHPELMQILKWCDEEKRIADVLLNTNGTKLADVLFIQNLARFAPKGRFSVYLQYDGTEEVGQKELRAGDFRSIREKAIANCRKYEIPVALVMTVTHENKFTCESAITKALSDENIRWVVFQPEFLSGRNDKAKLLEVPINVADIIHSVAKGEVMDTGSWMPLPCSDPNCGTVGFLVRKDGVWNPVSKFVDMTKFAPFIANRMNFDVDDSLAMCGCDNVSLEDELKAIGVEKKDIKMVFIKPFMDIRTWDEERIASCCTHVLTKEGKVDSFCRHYGLK